MFPEPVACTNTWVMDSSTLTSTSEMNVSYYSLHFRNVSKASGQYSKNILCGYLSIDVESSGNGFFKRLKNRG